MIRMKDDSLTAITSSEEFVDACFEWDMPEDYVGGEPTATPGVFYHGSPHSNIVDFKSQLELQSGEVGSPGLFFTQIPTYAASYARGRRNAENDFNGGRIYRLELITRNPFFPSPDSWAGAVLGDRMLEHSLCSDIKAAGYDSIVTYQAAHVIAEMIVFDKSQIRHLDQNIGTVRDIASLEGLTTETFYWIEGLPGPDYASDGASLFSNRERAKMVANGAVVRGVATAALNPIYCNQALWHRMEFDGLRYLHVGCLIDPSSGDALIIDRASVTPLNRAALRRKSSKKRRGRPVEEMRG